MDIHVSMIFYLIRQIQGENNIQMKCDVHVNMHVMFLQEKIERKVFTNNQKN